MEAKKPNHLQVVLSVTLGVLCVIGAMAPRSAWAQEKSTETKEEVAPAKAPEEGGKAQKQSDDLEEDLNKLKDEVFRSKARTSLMEEFLGKTAIEIKFRNHTRKDFELVSVFIALDNNELYKKEYAAGTAAHGKKEVPVFMGAATPGRHEMTVVLTYQGKKGGGYTDKDYQHLVREDFSFIANRAEITSVTISAEDEGHISDDRDRTPSNYRLYLDFKIETEDLAEKRQALEKRTIGIQIESGVLVDSYQLVSDRLNIAKQTGVGIPYGARANWWFLKYFGIEGYYNHANYNMPTGLGGPDMSVALDWVGVIGHLRYKFGPSIYYPEIGLRTSYNYLRFGVDSNSYPQSRVTSTYKYAEAGLQGKLPITWNFGIQGYISYLPWIDLDESPALASGYDSRDFGWMGEGGLYYNVWKDLTVNANYKIFWVEHDFNGRGTRTSANGLQLNLVGTETVLQGVMIGLRYDF